MLPDWSYREAMRPVDVAVVRDEAGHFHRRAYCCIYWYCTAGYGAHLPRPQERNWTEATSGEDCAPHAFTVVEWCNSGLLRIVPGI